MSDNEELPPLPKLANSEDALPAGDAEEEEVDYEPTDDEEDAGSASPAPKSKKDVSAGRPLRARRSQTVNHADDSGSEEVDLPKRRPAALGAKETPAQTHVTEITPHGFSILAPNKGKGLGKAVSELMDALNANARAAEGLADDMEAAGAVPPRDRDITEPSDTNERLDDLTAKVASLASAGSSVTHTGDSDLKAVVEGLRLKVRLHNQYLTSLGKNVNALTSGLAAVRAEVARVTGDVQAQKVQFGILAAGDPLPRLEPPAAASSSGLTRARSPNSEAALAVGQSPSKRQKGSNATAEASLVPAVSFGPWKGALQSKLAAHTAATDLINALPNSRELVLPYAVATADRNKSWIDAFFKSAEDRDAVYEAWRTPPPRFRDIKATSVDLPAPPAGAHIAGSGGNANKKSIKLRILSWNIHGEIELLGDPTMSAFFSAYGIMLLQETWLLPGEHEHLDFPTGYSVYSNARARPLNLAQQWGGVVTLVHESIDCSWRRDLSSPDCMVLETPEYFIVNGYLAPPASPEMDVAGPDPVMRFFGAVIACVAAGKGLIAAMDANARTGGKQAADWGPARESSDGKCDTRGRRLLEFLRSQGLAIVNGTGDSGKQSSGFTSKQMRGCSVIDYFVVSDNILPKVAKMVVGPVNNDYSDHSPLSLVLNGVSLKLPIRAEDPPPRLLPVLDPIPGQAALDKLLARVMDASLSGEEAIMALYGATTEYEGDHIYVYSDGSCVHTGRPDAKAGSGVCWGLGSDRNSSHRVPGLQTSPRGEIYAVLQAVLRTDKTRALHIRTDSETAIRTFCYWAPSFAEAGWTCENADLIAPTVAALAERTAVTRFSWVKAHSGNVLNDLADGLAAKGRDLPITALPRDLADKRPTLQGPYVFQPEDCPKVRTDLPRTPAPRAGKYKATVTEIADESETAPRTGGTAYLRGRAARRAKAAENLRTLEEVQRESQFWKFVHFVSHPLSRLAVVALDVLRNVFMERMNTPVELPDDFSAARLQKVKDEAAKIADCTVDVTSERHFSRRFTVDEVAALKTRIRDKALGEATGRDRRGYKDLLKIPNDVLCELFNACLELRNVPDMWLTTTLVALLKRRLDPRSAQSYRTVGLECCLLKFFTMLIDVRVRQWVDDAGLLPQSQNGFRAGFRTNNNSFILRCAMERARAQGRVLYLASIDISNAFPSVCHPLLWLKLNRLGMAGPLFDVFRLLYERMRYYVRSGKESSEEFAADMGILIGDPASPIMWLLFFADISIPDLPDDISLGGFRMSHLEQADDIVIFATSAASLQAKLDAFYKWCSSNFLLVNKLKSWWMPLASVPPAIPIFSLGGVPVLLAESQTYVGLRLCATTRNVFAQHAGGKSETAVAMSGLIFSLLDRRCLQCPPSVARSLYRAVIDPHLTHGCDVSPDSTISSVTKLEMAQNTYLRKLLRVGKRTATVALFSETGIVPIRYRRADLLLRFLGYLLQCPDDMYVRAAVRDSINLARQGRAGWYSDVQKSLGLLHTPVRLGFIEDSGEIDDLRAAVAESARTYVAETLRASAKLVLLQRRPRDSAVDAATWGEGSITSFRAYLRLEIPTHRVALTRLMTSDHGLAIERLRWEKVPQLERLCRFCREAVEDEAHAVLICDRSEELVQLRSVFWLTLRTTHPDLARALLVLRPIQILQLLAVHQGALPTFARFVRDVLRVFNATPLFRP